jgi:putative hemolysin
LEIILLTYVVLFFLLLILSAFFSASETAYFSLSSYEIEKLRKKTDYPTRQVIQLLSQPKKLLITIILGNTVVNIGAASLAAIAAIDICSKLNVDPRIGILIDVIIVTLVILIFTEIIPKVVAIKNYKKIVLKFSFALTFFYYLFSPLVSIFYHFTLWLSHLFRLNKTKGLFSEDELKSLVDFSEEQGMLQQDEKEMIHSIFEFSETTVKEIMVPRIDMVCVSINTKMQDLLHIVTTHLHSRIPLYKERVDNIIGIIYTKDLLNFINKNDNININLENLARPAFFVPEQKKIDELLREFQSEKIHMAIVVDEYGGTAGLVTLEDIIEEIVGEIQDEYDSEKPLYKKIGENEFIFDGSMDLEELNEILNINLPTEEGVETLAGFLFGLFGSVPKEKESKTYNGHEFIIEKVFRRRIKQVKIIKKNLNGNE